MSEGIQPKIVSAFPCLGKSYYAKTHPKLALDLESSSYLFDRTGYEDMDPEEFKGLPDRIPNPNGLDDYVTAIVDAVKSEQYRYIFISQNPEVIKALIKLGYTIWMVVPSNTEGSRRAFIQRALDRGNSTTWMQKVIKFIGRSLEEDYSSEEIKKIRRTIISDGLYLSDVVGLL